MSGRWLANDGFVERRACGSRIPAPTADWVAEVETGVEASLRDANHEAHHGFELVYEAVRERALELREDGWRVDQVLMAIKREVAACVAHVTARHDGADASRIPALLDAVVRWSVGAFYVGN